ncbi:nuclease-related domain-containing protein [Leifsonia sp. YAF41]|uniref:nuclease-related domain-containing protein n=1 Tax=Leifsonia sp. YAF41 TaxID=3233086 RepID=UPI003F98E4A9
MAVYERETKTVVCLRCAADSPSVALEFASSIEAEPLDRSVIGSAELQAEPFEVFTGNAGASARREHERRKHRREAKVRDAHPFLGNFILAVSNDPQSTRAWDTGARGEEILGARLDRLAGGGIHVLHDRRIPLTRANIDHIVVCPSGIFVIDAKKYRDRPTLRGEGGLIRPRVEKLMVGSRDRTNLVGGVRNQVHLVRSALEDAGLEGIPVRGVLCFIEADWPLFGGAFTIADVHVLWPRKAAEYVLRPGSVDDFTARLVQRALASSFPPA